MSSHTDSPLLAKIINGSIAGMIGVSSVYPLDLVKTQLQNQRVQPNGEKLYSSLFDCFKKIYNSEGLRGLYRGSAVTVTMATPEKMIKLTANDVLRTYLTTSDGKISLERQMLAGGSAGALQTIVSTPLELVKIRLQTASSENKSVTARTLISNVIKEKGITGIYKGIWPTTLRDVLFSMIFFPLYSAITEMGPHRPDGSVPSWCSLLVGFFAGSVSAISVTPFDVIKTRIQSSLRQTDGNKDCIGMIDCTVNTYAKEGVTAFFKGGLCRVIVLAPLLGIAQCFYFLGVGEKIVNFFSS